MSEIDLDAIPGGRVRRRRLAALDDEVTRGEGWALIRGLDAAHVLDIARSLGSPIERGGVGVIFGGLVRSVRIREYGDPVFNDDTCHDKPCHNDGISWDHPPDLVMLVCVRPADRGGDTVLLPSRDLMAGLDGSQRALAWRTVVPTGSGRHRLVDGEPSRPSMRFFGPGIRRAASDLGHEFSVDERELLARFEQLSATDRAPVRFRLNVGDAVVIDNHTVLHGRTAFEPGSNRELLHVYITREQR